ncbi:MAG: helix-turn-helix transcriptional regulator [Dehalococcoidia bacterium]
MPNSTRDLLAHLAISLKDVAKAIGVSHETVRGWSSGRSEPTPKNREKLLSFVEQHNTRLGDLARGFKHDRPD